MEKQSKILITGASGLIGRSLVKLLREEGYKNIFTPSHKAVDLCNQKACNAMFWAIEPEYVFHLASHVGGIADNSDHPAQFVYDNTMMHCNVFDAANQVHVKKILFPGSACAYPAIADRMIKESDFLTGPPEITNIAYAAAKINGIIMAQAYAKEYGMKVVLPMVANTYGPGDKSSHVIPMMIEKFRSAKAEAILWGTGSPLREFIHAYDVAKAFLFLMLNYDSPEIINVGTMQEITIEKLAVYVATCAHFHGPLEFDKTKPDGVMRKCLDSSRLRNLGWVPTIGLSEGLHDYIQNPV